MKTILFFILISAAFVQAQQTAEIGAVRAQWITQLERADTVLPKGLLAFDELNPALLYIGDGLTPGGILVAPAPQPWDYLATQDIVMQGNRVQLGHGYSLLALGTYSALSGNGEIQASPGRASWSVNAVDLIRLQAGELLTSITSFTWHPADGEAGQFQLIIQVGDNETVPTIQAATNLVAQDWTDITPASITAPADGLRTVRIDYDGDSTLLFFRAILPAQAASIELLANTSITGDLTVSGILTGANTVQIGGEAPATSTSPGTPGTLIQAGNYLYICIAIDTWRRVTLLDWE